MPILELMQILIDQIKETILTSSYEYVHDVTIIYIPKLFWRDYRNRIGKNLSKSIMILHNSSISNISQ